MSVDLPTWTAFDPEAPGALPAFPPPAGRAVVLLASSAATQAGWGPELAADLARAWSRAGRRVVLADLGLARPSLHEAFGEPSGEGVTDAVRFGASPKRVARPVDGEAFFLVPAGTVVADPAETLAAGRWASLCKGFVDAGVVFALYLPQDEPGRTATMAVATDVVVLASEDEDSGTLTAGVDVPVRAVLGPAEKSAGPEQDETAFEASTVAATAEELPEPAVVAPESEAEEIDTPVEPVPEEEDTPVEPVVESLPEAADFGAPAPEESPPPEEYRVPDPAELMERAGPVDADVPESAALLPLVDGGGGASDSEVPGRAAGRTRTRLLVLLLLVVVLAALVAAWLGYIQIPGITPRAGSAAVPVRVRTVLPSAPPRPTSPVQGFSVAVAAYRDGEAARAEARALSAHAAGALVIAVPLRVGDAIMHRVLIGPARDSASASALAGRVAASMRADDSRWIVRATPLALRLGEMKDRAAAERRVATLQGMDIPAYVMAVHFTDGSTRYRIYAGAFSDTADASYLSERVHGRGFGDPTLTSRIGRLPE